MSTAGVFQSTIAHELRESLNAIVTDDTDGVEKKLILPKWMKEYTMRHAYEDDIEIGGLGLATEKPEGTEMQAGAIKEGVLTRYIARTFALRVHVSREAMEDNQYPKAIDAGRRLKRAIYKTADIDATNVLIRGFNSSFPIGDGLALWSASHTLPNGGTFSNILATPMSPSRSAFIIATSQIYQYPSQDGVIEGYVPECIVCPVQQWAVWAGVVKSTHAPEPGAFNEINVVNTEINPDIVPIKYWTNTSTNWALVTDAEDGFKWFWRRKPEGRDWVDEDAQVLKFGISARWARGVSNPRCTLGSQA